jgi:hypothetical protein
MQPIFVLTFILILTLPTLAQAQLLSSKKRIVQKIQCASVWEISANLRTKPNQKSAVVLILNKHEQLEILQKTTAWYFVKLSGSQVKGYIRRQDILLNPCQIRGLPVSQTKPSSKTIVDIGLQILDLKRQNICQFKWDKSNDSSNVGCVFSPDDRSYKFAIAFSFKGNLSSRPEKYSFAVRSIGNKSSIFERSAALQIIADGKKSTLQNWSYTLDDLKTSENSVNETIFFYIPADTLEQMSFSTQSEISIGSVSFKLTKETKQILQDILKLSSLN